MHTTGYGLLNPKKTGRITGVGYTNRVEPSGCPVALFLREVGQTKVCWQEFLAYRVEDSPALGILFARIWFAFRLLLSILGPTRSSRFKPVISCCVIEKVISRVVSNNVVT